jgi:hypothetical protein
MILSDRVLLGGHEGISLFVQWILAILVWKLPAIQLPRPNCDTTGLCLVPVAIETTSSKLEASQA